MKIVWLTGNYVNSHERQTHAKLAGCRLVVEFHFNSFSGDAKGGEVWHKPDDPRSESIARSLLDAYKQVGLPIHGPGVSPAVVGTRAAWIRHYDMPAVLLEPLFVTNDEQANWIHDEDNVQALAKALSSQLAIALSPESIIGLSIGHMFRDERKNDKGAECTKHDWEADHAQDLANAVSGLLVPGETGGTHLETKSRTHVIVSGDTLGSIAARFNLSVDALMAANAQITDPNKVITGQTIEIPTSASNQPSVEGNPPLASDTTYLIVRNDNLTKIAARYRLTVDELLAANPQITDRNLIVVGQTLSIPGTRTAPASTSVTVSTVDFGRIPSGMPDTSGKSDQEKFDIYEDYFKVSGVDITALPEATRAILGLRVTTNTNANGGHGIYDDRFVVCWSSGGSRNVREYKANTEPCSFYEDTPIHRQTNPRKIFGVDAGGDSRRDLGCLPDGKYQYHKESDPIHGNILRPDSDIFVVRDINHDGVFDQTDEKLARLKSLLNSDRTILFHSAGSGFTGSAGCQTMERDLYEQFWNSLGSQKEFTYVLVTVR